MAEARTESDVERSARKKKQAVLSSVPPSKSKLAFELTPHSDSECILRLTNNSNKYVAYTIKTTDPKRYNVNPPKAVMSVRANAEVRIIIKDSNVNAILTESVEMGAPVTAKSDRFLVKCRTISHSEFNSIIDKDDTFSAMTDLFHKSEKEDFSKSLRFGVKFESDYWCKEVPSIAAAVNSDGAWQEVGRENAGEVVVVGGAGGGEGGAPETVAVVDSPQGGNDAGNAFASDAQEGGPAGGTEQGEMYLSLDRGALTGPTSSDSMPKRGNSYANETSSGAQWQAGDAQEGATSQSSQAHVAASAEVPVREPVSGYGDQGAVGHQNAQPWAARAGESSQASDTAASSVAATGAAGSPGLDAGAEADFAAMREKYNSLVSFLIQLTAERDALQKMLNKANKDLTKFQKAAAETRVEALRNGGGVASAEEDDVDGAAKGMAKENGAKSVSTEGSSGFSLFMVVLVALAAFLVGRLLQLASAK